MKISRRSSRNALIALTVSLVAVSSSSFADTFHFGEGDASVGSANTNHGSHKVTHGKTKKSQGAAAQKKDATPQQ
jgi:hypothetical protein